MQIEKDSTHGSNARQKGDQIYDNLVYEYHVHGYDMSSWMGVEGYMYHASWMGIDGYDV